MSAEAGPNVHFIADPKGNIESKLSDCKGCDGYGRRITLLGEKKCDLEGCRGHLPHKIRIRDEVIFGTPSGVKSHDVDASGRRKGTSS
ncbi:MAG: hypothetical protein RLZZ283_195 [Candidatus Parcubacteria bacterium]|jgi:hypothetical protein